MVKNTTKRISVLSVNIDTSATVYGLWVMAKAGCLMLLSTMILGIKPLFASVLFVLSLMLLALSLYVLYRLRDSWRNIKEEMRTLYTISKIRLLVVSVAIIISICLSMVEICIIERFGNMVSRFFI